MTEPSPDVADLVRGGRFREDLYHRLAVFSLVIPALVERQEDIADLAVAFGQFFAARTKRRVSALSSGGVRLLLSYGCPGKRREASQKDGHRDESQGGRVTSAPKPYPPR